MARRPGRPRVHAESCQPWRSSVGVDRHCAHIGSSSVRPSCEAPELNRLGHLCATSRSEDSNLSMCPNSPDHQLNRRGEGRRCDAPKGRCRQAAVGAHRASSCRRPRRGSEVTGAVEIPAHGRHHRGARRAGDTDTSLRTHGTGAAAGVPGQEITSRPPPFAGGLGSTRQSRKLGLPSPVSGVSVCLP